MCFYKFRKIYYTIILIQGCTLREHHKLEGQGKLNEMIDYMVNRFCIVEWSFQNLIAAIENDIQQR